MNGIHEVGGSIPPGSTNLRGLRPLLLRKPNMTLRAKRAKAAAPKGAGLRCEVRLYSPKYGRRTLLRWRHNSSAVLHTSKYLSWSLKAYSPSTALFQKNGSKINRRATRKSTCKARSRLKSISQSNRHSQIPKYLWACVERPGPPSARHPGDASWRNGQTRGRADDPVA